MQWEGVYSVQRFNSKQELQDWSIAVRPEVRERIQRIMWRDGTRGRVVDYTKLNDLNITFPSEVNEDSFSTKPLPSKITVIDRRTDSYYVLQPLTLEIYRENIKERLSGHPDFTSEPEMTKFFLNLSSVL